MKLLTTGGLLYSSVQAANPDGTSGTYQSFDYVAMLPETANGGLNAASTATPINIGWDPVVTEILSSYDGGKVIAGIGKLSGTVYASWVIKMWGNVGATKCGAASKITGYVTMVMGVSADLTATTQCSATTDAKVQWAWTNAATDRLTTLANRYSYVVTSASEDWHIGVDGGSSGSGPYIIIVGGTTLTTDITSYSSYGMGSWGLKAEYITMDGVPATGTALTPTAIGTELSLEIVFKDTDNEVYQAAADVEVNKNTVTAMNHCWTAVNALSNSTVAKRQTVGGFTGSVTSCLKHAIDGYSFWGGILIATIGSSFVAASFTIAAGGPSIKALGTIINDNKGTHGAAGMNGLNFAQPRVVTARLNLKTATATENLLYILCTSQEYYFRSIFFTTAYTASFTAVDGGTMAHATYGQVWNLWTYKMDETGTADLAAQVPDNFIFCGTKAGKGTLFKWGMTTFKLGTIATTFTVDTTSNVRLISAPTGGMGQFKGLTYTTTEAKYVQTICKSVQPMYYVTWKAKLETDTGNGWVVQCYTGIPQCEVDIADGYTQLQTSSGTETATCMNDPRYMTWRAHTAMILVNGTMSWYRTDSYWNSSKSMFSSTMGTGIVLSTNVFSNVDNNHATTNLGKTFVFAYGDGSGIQLNHIAFGTTPHASNNSAGAGTNTLSTSPSSFTNTSPNMYNQQHCLGSNLELTGTTDTSGLASTITEWSDGYKAKVTLNLEMILPGAAGGWRGICMVYYSSQYVMDNTNGSICFAAQVDSATGKGPIDFAAGYLMSVASSVWQPPANKASLQPNSSSLTGGKYSITYTPSAATAFMYTEGYFATVQWYQPKYASSYSGVARYGKDDYVGSYCMQGSGSNSYFGAPAASVKLTGAMYLAVGVISLGTVLSLAI